MANVAIRYAGIFSLNLGPTVELFSAWITNLHAFCGNVTICRSILSGILTK